MQEEKGREKKNKSKKGLRDKKKVLRKKEFFKNGLERNKI